MLLFEIFIRVISGAMREDRREGGGAWDNTQLREYVGQVGYVGQEGYVVKEGYVVQEGYVGWKGYVWRKGYMGQEG